MKAILQSRLGLIAAALWVGLGAVCFGVGGDDPSRVSLLGSIKHDGEPLDHGTIHFFLVPEPAQPITACALIHHGRFVINDSDTLVPGRYMVKVSGLGINALSVPAGREREALLLKEPLHARYNEKSELEVVIPHGGTRHLEFNLKR